MTIPPTYSPYRLYHMPKKERYWLSTALHICATVLVTSAIMLVMSVTTKLMFQQKWLLRSFFWSVIGAMFIMVALIVHSIIDTEFNKVHPS